MMPSSSLDSGRVAVVGWARTPFGRFGGALRDVRLPHLGAIPVLESIKRSGLSLDDVDEVAIGVNFPGSERSVARQVALRAGLPETVPAFTIDRACCSSMSAITMASRGIRLAETRIAVAGGVDNLSRVPFFVHEMRFGKRLGDIQLTDQLVVSCPHTGVPRAVQASTEAAEFGVDRRAQDEWAVRSQETYERARSAGWIESQLVPVDLLDVHGRRAQLDRDEVPRPDTTLEALSALPTVHGSETVTAGNAPNMSSGAAALVLAQPDVGRELADISVTLEAMTMVSGDPNRIASIPAHAASASLSRAGLNLGDIDVIEINEAFAAVPIVSARALADQDGSEANEILERTNADGGAIAVGHPTGATAARLVMSAIERLQRRGGGLALVSICGGVGEAEALVVRVSD